MDPSKQLSGVSNVFMTGGMVTHVNGNYYHVHGGVKGGYERLLDEIAPNALHDSGHILDLPKCHPNTRVAVIQKILEWASAIDADTQDKLVMWLSGAAGAGKSAIGRSISEQWIAKGLLLASFFFGRTDSTRNHARSLIPTLAYQIGIIHPGIRQSVASCIEHDPMIFSRSLLTQFRSLIINPLSNYFANQPQSSPFLIVIDGLDECTDETMQHNILLTIMEVLTSSKLPLRVLVCSRPESRITAAFSSTKMRAILGRLHLGNEYHPDEDIRLYLQDHFDEIRDSHIFKESLSSSWPSTEIIDELVEKSSGQFIYAATVAKYVESSRHLPHQRLDAVLNLHPPFKDLPFTELDMLYTYILLKADDISMVLRILAFPLLYHKFYIIDIEMMLGLEPGNLRVYLSELGSLVELSPVTHPFPSVRILHGSLADFFLDPQRSQTLSINSVLHKEQHICSILQRIADPCNKYAFRYASMGPFNHMYPELPRHLYTQELVQAVDSISIPAFLESPLRHSASFLRFFFNFLVLSKEIDQIKPLYWKHVNSLCDTVLMTLQEHHIDDCEMNLSFSLDYLVPWRPSGYDPSVIFSKSTRNSYFRMQVMQYLPSSPGLEEVVSSLSLSVDDQHRQQIFARSATYCIQWLCERGKFEEETSQILGVIDKAKRRGRPWIWRRMSPRRFPFKQLVAVFGSGARFCFASYNKALREKNLTGAQNTIYSMKEYLRRQKSKKSYGLWSGSYWTNYFLLLNGLAYFLPRAERYDPLIDMCQNRMFASMSCLIPKHARRARTAMRNYLGRVEAG